MHAIDKIIILCRCITVMRKNHLFFSLNIAVIQLSRIFKKITVMRNINYYIVICSLLSLMNLFIIILYSFLQLTSGVTVKLLNLNIHRVTYVEY